MVENVMYTNHLNTGLVRYSNGQKFWPFGLGWVVKSNLQKVRTCNVSGFEMVGFHIPTIIVCQTLGKFQFGAPLMWCPGRVPSLPPPLPLFKYTPVEKVESKMDEKRLSCTWMGVTLKVWLWLRDQWELPCCNGEWSGWNG